ncbi:hypothetical protein [Kutzneria albida]|uniref:DUF4224 domain-containing protein n=1 Tax=Kutzneria albida DSM 43870 TaxID=1449976 RepID=W5WJG8_9PSEU|nr:hypothetical protein [Kutzneria albida]AHH98309.1 hypothetical protein KALB_4947 [Kutzneria albida DSM 43870]
MTRKLLTTADIAELRGLANAAVARTWIRRVGLKAVDRDPVTDAKLYDQGEVQAAAKSMPGKGVGGGRPSQKSVGAAQEEPGK